MEITESIVTWFFSAIISIVGTVVRATWRISWFKTDMSILKKEFYKHRDEDTSNNILVKLASIEADMVWLKKNFWYRGD